MVENIIYSGEIIARIIGTEELSGPFKFFTEDKDPIQISRWNHPKGYVCKAHIHNILRKTIHRTHEAIFVLQGELLVEFFSLDGKPICQRNLYAPCVCYSMDCGHEYTVLTDDCMVMEFKNGPFSGDENYDKERTLIDPNNFYEHEKI